MGTKLPTALSLYGFYFGSIKRSTNENLAGFLYDQYGQLIASSVYLIGFSILSNRSGPSLTRVQNYGLREEGIYGKDKGAGGGHRLKGRVE